MMCSRRACSPTSTLRGVFRTGADGRRMIVLYGFVGSDFGKADAAQKTRLFLHDASVEVELDGELHRLRWPRGQTLVDTMLEAGINVPHSCREGHCGACAVLKKSGEVVMEINDVLEQSDLDEGLILGCQALPKSDSVEVTYDE